MPSLVVSASVAMGSHATGCSCATPLSGHTTCTKTGVVKHGTCPIHCCLLLCSKNHPDASLWHTWSMTNDILPCLDQQAEQVLLPQVVSHPL